MAETPAPGFIARVGMRVEVIGKDQVGKMYIGPKIVNLYNKSIKFNNNVY